MRLITSIGKGTIGCGFFDPSGSTTCNIKKVIRGILLDVNTQENETPPNKQQSGLFSQEFHLKLNYFAGKRAQLSKEHGSQHRENK
jgi:hypothetical protein